MPIKEPGKLNLWRWLSSADESERNFIEFDIYQHHRLPRGVFSALRAHTLYQHTRAQLEGAEKLLKEDKFVCAEFC